MHKPLYNYVFSFLMSRFLKMKFLVHNCNLFQSYCKVLLCNSGEHEIYFVGQADLELRSTCFCFPSSGINVWTIVIGFSTSLTTFAVVCLFYVSHSQYQKNGIFVTLICVGISFDGLLWMWWITLEVLDETLNWYDLE